MPPGKTQGDWSRQLEAEIKAAGFRWDDPAVESVWDAYQHRGYTKAVKVLQALAAATPAGPGAHIPVGALGGAPAGVEKTMQTFGSIAEDIYSAEEELLRWEKAVKSGRELSFDETIDAEDICRAADQVALRCVALIGTRPKPIKSGAYHAVKALFDQPDPGALYAVGSAVKAIGSGKVEGYLVRFGGDGDLTRFRDVFTKNTYFGRAREVDAMTHHGQLPPPYGDRLFQNPAQLERDDLGIFCKLILDLSDQFEAAMYRLTQQNKLGWSSGALGHTVKRTRLPSGASRVDRWIIGEASLTPQPAGGKQMAAAAAMKALLLDAGVDLSRAPARRPVLQDAQPGAAAGSTVVPFNWERYTGGN